MPRATCCGSATARPSASTPPGPPSESDRENVSIGAAETTLIRKLNRRLKDAGLPSEEYRRLVRELVVHETLAQRDSMTKVTLPPAAFPWADEVADEWIEWIVGSGIDVIGDVEDLRPVPPEAGTPWANPDRPRRVEMVDAALDAVVALALEAATGPTRTSRSPPGSAARPVGCGGQ